MTADRPGAVAVPRGLLLGLGLALAASSLAAAFLLGRESARAELGAGAVASAAPAANRAPPESTTSPEMKSMTSSSANDAPQLDLPSPAPAPAAGAAAVGAAAVGAPADLPPASLAVAAWLDRLDRALMEGKTWTDPDTMAQTILQDALAGRTDGFDRLIAGNQSVHDRILALRPPADCAECARYHAATVAVLSDSIRLLRRLRESTATGDLGALAGAQGEAQGLEARARDIERLDQELRKAYRLP